MAGEFCPWSYEPDELLPTPDLPTNAVFGPYHDIDPSVGGQIEFITVGVAHNGSLKSVLCMYHILAVTNY